MASVLNFYLMLIISKYLKPLLNVTCNVLAQMPPQQVPVSCLCQEMQASVHQGPVTTTTPVWGLMVFSPLPCAAWEVLLTMPVVHTPAFFCPL